jgi:hypothetical protein
MWGRPGLIDSIRTRLMAPNPERMRVGKAPCCTTSLGILWSPSGCRTSGGVAVGVSSYWLPRGRVGGQPECGRGGLLLDLISLTLFQEERSTAGANGNAVGAPRLSKFQISAVHNEKLDGPLWGVSIADQAPPSDPSHLAFRVPSACAGYPWRFTNFGLRSHRPATASSPDSCRNRRMRMSGTTKVSPGMGTFREKVLEEYLTAMEAVW